MKKLKYSKYLLALFISSCSMNKANLYNGEFQVFDPVLISGNSKPIADTISSSASLSINYGKNKTVSLSGLYNNGHQDDGDGFLNMPDSVAIVNYRIVQTSANFNINRLYKSDKTFYGAYIGAGPFPYISPTFGYNTDKWEIGAGILMGYFANKVKCSGHRVNEKWDGRDKSEDYSINRYYWHQYHSANIYSNIYMSNFNINYSGAVAYPYGVFKSIDGYDLSFQFPYIIKNSLGFGYNLGQKSFKIGINQIFGGKFDEKMYSAQVSFGSNI